MMKFDWPQTLCLIEHFQLSDELSHKLLGTTAEGLAEARLLQQSGAFADPVGFNPAKHHSEVFGTIRKHIKTDAKAATKSEVRSPTKRVATKGSVPTPRPTGSNGKIATAFKLVPEDPVLASEFCIANDISLAVLRQSRRFISSMDEDVQEQIGTIFVRQDKVTKELMVWRTPR